MLLERNLFNANERNAVLGASELASLMGCSRYGSAKSMLNNKKKEIVKPTSWVQEAGQNFEMELAKKLPNYPAFRNFRHNCDTISHPSLPLVCTPDMIDDVNKEGMEIKYVQTNAKNLRETFLQFLDDNMEVKLSEVIEGPKTPLTSNNILRMHLFQCVMCMWMLWLERDAADKRNINYYLCYRVKEFESEDGPYPCHYVFKITILHQHMVLQVHLTMKMIGEVFAMVLQKLKQGPLTKFPETKDEMHMVEGGPHCLLKPVIIKNVTSRIFYPKE